MKKKLIKRTYRISKEHDKHVKKNKKKAVSESGFIRMLIEENIKINS